MRDKLLASIPGQLLNMKDYQGKPVSDFVEQEKALKYWRVKTEKESVYEDVTGNKITVPGVIMSANKYVMRTDGVIVEALLGQGDALDAYSHGLQDQAVRAKEMENRASEIEGSIKYLGTKIVNAKDADSAKIFGQVFPCCKQPMYSLLPPKDKEKENGPQNTGVTV
jgi:hypothetical protein